MIKLLTLIKIFYRVIRAKLSTANLIDNLQNGLKMLIWSATHLAPNKFLLYPDPMSKKVVFNKTLKISKREKIL